MPRVMKIFVYTREGVDAATKWHFIFNRFDPQKTSLKDTLIGSTRPTYVFSQPNICIIFIGTWPFTFSRPNELADTSQGENTAIRAFLSSFYREYLVRSEHVSLYLHVFMIKLFSLSLIFVDTQHFTLDLELLTPELRHLPWTFGYITPLVPFLALGIRDTFINTYKIFGIKTADRGKT